MGAGIFNTSASAARASMRANTGATAFMHDIAARAGKTALLHKSMDVTRKTRRESRDVPGKQPATPIMVWLDVTGSMSQIPSLLIQDLNKLMKLVVEGQVVTDPQICFAAIGDATSDRVPVQVGEFEADDKLAEAHLANIFLEGAGGGQNKESYELALWFAGNQVDTDAFEKRQEKGFLFIIGDEAPYPKVRRDLVKTYLGENIRQDVSLRDAVKQASEKFHVFVIRPGGTSNYADPGVQKIWTGVLEEERVIQQENWQDIVPLMAGTISIMSGETLDDTVAAMAASGFDTDAIHNASKALVPLAKNAPAPLAKGRILTNNTGGIPTAQRL
jgi:hypothetical protein